MDQMSWTIISGLFGGIVLLMLLLYRSLKAELDATQQQGNALIEQGKTFEAFRAMDAEREEHWTRWRSSIEDRITSYEKGTAEWRHHEITPALRRIEERLNTVIETVRHVEKKLDSPT